MSRDELVVARIAEELRRCPPQRATAAVIALCEHAIQLIGDDQKGSALWLDLHSQLGAFLLECREGDRADNVARAEKAYRRVLAYSSPETSPDAWQAGRSGLADSLVAAPSAKQPAFDEAISIYCDLIARLGSAEDSERLAIVLGNCASAIQRQPEGDQAMHLEQSLVLRKVVVGLHSPTSNPALWGRAMYNLGVLYLLRRRGIRTQNVDDAVAALREALTVHTIDSDPVGRVRTLRTLARVYPEWTGADSLSHGRRLADQALQEAGLIEQSEPIAAGPTTTGWASFARRKSALTFDFEPYLGLSNGEQLALFNEMAASHNEALKAIPRDTMPSLWADWVGGYGHVLAQFPHLGEWKHVQEAHTCFQSALAALEPLDEPRLRLDVLRRAGEFYHEIGAFQDSYFAHSAALDVGDILFDWAASSESRERELGEVRGFALLGAYAAARLNKFSEAVRLAERGRARAQVETLSAVELALGQAPESVRDRIAAINSIVAALEEEYNKAQQNDPASGAAEVRANLADFLGCDPCVFGLRIVSAGDAQTDQSVPEVVRLSAELARARAELRAALRQVATPQLSAQDITGVASRASFPIIYLFATIHGATALAVPPDGPIEAITLADINSDQTRDLLYGDKGYINAAYGVENSIGDSLTACLHYLGEHLLNPIGAWLTGRDFARAALIPLGSLGLLPLHAACDTAAPVYTYAPSARALSYALTSQERRVGQTSRLLAVGDPTGNLPMAGAEAWSVGAAFGTSPTTILLGAAATASAVFPAMTGATHLHLSCHGRFRASDPQASTLLLAGSDHLTLGQILSGSLDLSCVRLAFLSACQSGSQEFRNIPDESMGFPFGFLLGGVPGIVSAFWPVDVNAAALFARCFYEKHLRQGLGPAEAVAQSRQWLRTATSEELATYVDAIRRELPPAGEPNADSWDEALSDLWLDLVAREPSKRPFMSPEHWAAFAYTGA